MDMLSTLGQTAEEQKADILALVGKRVDICSYGPVRQNGKVVQPWGESHITGTVTKAYYSKAIGLWEAEIDCPNDIGMPNPCTIFTSDLVTVLD